MIYYVVMCTHSTRMYLHSCLIIYDSVLIAYNMEHE